MTERQRQSIPPSVAWRLAICSLQNVGTLAQASRELITKGFHGPAMSLAISAREELGKFFRALNIAFEVESGPAADEALRRHKVKQAIGLVLGGMSDLADFGRLRLDLSDVHAETAEEVFSIMGDRLAESVSQMSFNEGAVPVLDEAIQSALAGDDERLRQSGLYTDAECSDGTWIVRSPSSITEVQASEQLKKLDGFLQFVSGMGSRVSVSAQVDALPVPDEDLVRRSIARIVPRIDQQREDG